MKKLTQILFLLCALQSFGQENKSIIIKGKVIED